MNYILLFVLFSTAVLTQNRVNVNNLYSEFALESSREKYRDELNQLFKTAFSDDVLKVDEALLRNALYKAELTLNRSELTHKGLMQCFVNFDRFGKLTRKGIFLAAKACFPNSFVNESRSIYDNTDDPEIFIYSALYLLSAGNSNLNSEKILTDLKNRFPTQLDDPLIRNFMVDMEFKLSDNYKTPDLKKIFSHEFQKGKTIIFSLHRKDRKYSGITIIRKPDGYFLRNEDGTLFSIPQLAESASGYPGYLTGGNTPQGIFSVQAFYVSETEDIGPTPSVLTRIAFEKPTSVFYHKKVENKNYIIEDYKNLLPESWQNFPPIYQAYYAGKLGRRLIVMHGSVDDLDFYKNEIYYPLTPTRGCISAKELWSEKTGKCLESDQAKLMNAFFSTGQLYGFLVVIDIDDKNFPVQVEEISNIIDELEQR